MSNTPGSNVAYGRLFRNRSFMALWSGQTVSFIGDYFYWLAIPIMVQRLTGSPSSPAPCRCCCSGRRPASLWIDGIGSERWSSPMCCARFWF
jgi:hypothetical protein